MRTQWVPVWETKQKEIVFVCVACDCECVSVAPNREKAGKCPREIHGANDVNKRLIRSYEPK